MSLILEIPREVTTRKTNTTATKQHLLHAVLGKVQEFVSLEKKMKVPPLT